jgi:hypothetical protein
MTCQSEQRVCDGEAVLVVWCSGWRRATVAGRANSGKRLGVRWREWRATAASGEEANGRGMREAGHCGWLEKVSVRAHGGHRRPSAAGKRRMAATGCSIPAVVGTRRRRAGARGGRKWLSGLGGFGQWAE